MTGSATVTRYTPSRPCPICGGNDRLRRGKGVRCAGYLTGDGRVAFCSREEKAGSLQVAGDSNCFPHRLEGRCGCGVSHGEAPPPPVRRAPRDTRPWRPVAHYDYHDRDGAVRFQVIRLEPDPNPDGDKRFTQRRVDPLHPGHWIEGPGAMEGVQLLPYRLPDLLKDPKRLILIVEGEKAVDALRRRGLPATTCPMGAGKWWDAGGDCPRTELTSWMLADVAGRGDNRLPVVIGDNDDAGRRGAEAACRAFAATGLDPHLLTLIGVKEHGGADDWIDQDPARTARDLIAQLPGERWLDLQRGLVVAGATVTTGGDGASSAPPREEVPAASPGAGPALTDLGNAERLVAVHGERFRFDHTAGGRHVWGGPRWRPDADAEIEGAANRVIHGLYEGAWQTDDKAMSAHALRSQQRPRLEAMVALARALIPIAVSTEAWNRDPYLLNVANGTLDLRTGELRPHYREDMLTQLAPVDFDPAALAPRWQAFLEEILGGHEGLVSFVQRAVGLSLIGQVLEHVFFLSYGKGANGKTTFLAVIHGVLGDYARQADSELLLAHRDAVHPTGLADLRGARFVSSSEVEDGRRFSEATMKILTGETLRKARFMHQDFFEYTPSDTIWLAVNHKPKVQGTDEGFWRRIRALPFTVTIPPERQDRHLAERLLAEAPGILAWAVRGCLDYQARGLAPPDCVVEATTQYREEEDILGAFLQERCVVFPGLTVGATELYHDYVEWGNAAGEHPVAQTRFGIQLRERGFEKGRAQSPRDILIYRGLGLTDSTRGRDGREGPDTSAGYPLSRARVRDQFAGTHDLSLSYSETVPLDSTIPAHEHTKDRAADTEYPADTPDVPPQNGGEVIL